MRLARDAHRSVMVAVAVVRVMQVAIDEIVDVIAMRHRIVSTAGAVNVIGRVAGARMAVAAGRGIRGCHGEVVLHNDAVGFLMMQMAVMQVIDVATVLQCDVPTTGTVCVIVIGMFRHGRFLFKTGTRRTLTASVRHRPGNEIPSPPGFTQSGSLPCAKAFAIRSRTCPSDSE